MLEDCVFYNFELLPIFPFLGRHSNMQRVLLTVLHLVLFASGQEDLVDSLEADWEDGEWDSREGRFSFPRYLSLHSVRDITECKEKSAKVQKLSCIAVEENARDIILCKKSAKIQNISSSPVEDSKSQCLGEKMILGAGEATSLKSHKGDRWHHEDVLMEGAQKNFIFWDFVPNYG